MDIKIWLEEITFKLHREFGSRLLFVGYQGSYKRGEATPDSDIDMVVILDSLALQDLRLYKGIIASMPESEKACGFISGKEELQSWSPADLFQFYYETAALYGELHSLIAAPRQKDIEASVKSAAEALYHQAVHGYLYDRNLFESLKQLYKMSFFIIQAQYFLKQGIYIPVKKELLPLLSGRDKDVLENSMNRDCIKDYSPARLDEAYELLISWCSEIIKNPAS